MANISFQDSNGTFMVQRNNFYYANATATEQKSLYDQGENEVDEFVYNYIGPIFIIAGIIGNTVAFVTLCRPPLNNFSSSVYLSAYALSALFNLLFSIGLDWCLHMYGKNHFKHSVASVCRLWEFFERVINYSGVWFIIGGAIDRFIGLWIPSKSQDFCTVFIAKTSVSITLTGITALNVHAMWLYELYHDIQCTINIHFEFNLIWFWVSWIFSTVLPQLILFIIGNLLIVRLCLKHRGRQIPETVTIEMDLTYTVMILSMVFCFFSFPASIVKTIGHLNGTLRLGHRLNMTIVNFTHYMTWMSFSCLMLILALRSRAFRDSVYGMLVSCVMFLRNGTSAVELKHVSEDYEQVPSTSTTL